MKIQERDLKIIDFIKRVVVADTETIHKMFFNNCSLRCCQRRLQKLEEGKYIKSFREDILKQKISANVSSSLSDITALLS